MTNHLLPVTVEVLRTLPLSTPTICGGVAMSAKDALLAHRLGSGSWSAKLDPEDEIVRAVVAARIVPGWYDGATDAEIIAALGGSEPDDEDLLGSAVIALRYARGMDPDMPAGHVSILTRLARAASEAK